MIRSILPCKRDFCIHVISPLLTGPVDFIFFSNVCIKDVMGRQQDVWRIHYKTILIWSNTLTQSRKLFRGDKFKSTSITMNTEKYMIKCSALENSWKFTYIDIIYPSVSIVVLVLNLGNYLQWVFTKNNN